MSAQPEATHTVPATTARALPRGLLWLALPAWLLLTLGLRPLALPDEGRYVGVAWEMLRNGDWLVPTLDGLPYFHKPPLFYWITAASLKVFGLHPMAARMAPLLGALLAAWSLHRLLARWVDARTAAWTVVVLATMPFFYGGAQFANLDMLVAGCISACIAFAADAALLPDTDVQGRRTALLAAWATAALGVLAKGLIGAVLPAAVLATWLVLAGRWRTIPRLLWWPALLLFAAITTPWFVAMEQQHPGFLRYFFVLHHFKRFTQAGFNNEQPFWFYLPVVLLLTLPWCLALRSALRPGPERGEPQALLRLLWWVWAIGIGVFFSLPRSKLVGYVLPVLPPLAALLADGLWSRTCNVPRTQRRMVIAAAASAAICVAALGATMLVDRHSSAPLAAPLLAQRAPGEPVYFVGDYFYDLPLLARLDQPVRVVEAWTASDVATRDNWRRELAEAGDFAAPALRHQVLVDRHAFAAEACAHTPAWVVATQGAAKAQPLLSAPALAHNSRGALWRVDAATCAALQGGLSAAQTPSAGLPGR